MAWALALVLSVAACGQEQPANVIRNGPQAAGPQPCQKAQLVSIVYNAPSIECPNAGEGASHTLIADGINISLGRELRQVIQDARRAGAAISRGDVTRFSLVTENPSPFGSPFQESRTYSLASENGRVTGVSACETYASGQHRRRLSTAMVEAFGPPRSVSGGLASATMTWPEGHSLNISGSPNLVKIRVGSAPSPSADRGDGFERALFNEVVREEDRRPGDFQGARFHHGPLA
jgi:hypothetical protein